MPLGALAALALIPGPVAKPEVLDVEFSRDDRLVAVSFGRSAVHLYEAATGRLHRRLAVPGARLIDLEFSPDGRWLVCSNHVFGGSSPLWEVGSWRLAGGLALARSKRVHDPVVSVEWAGGGAYVVGIGLAGGGLVAWDVQAKRPAFFARQFGPFHGFAVAPGSTTVAVREGGRPLRFWQLGDAADARWGQEAAGLPPGPFALRFNREAGRLVAVSRHGGEVWVAEPAGRRRAFRRRARVPGLDLRDLAWGRDGSTLYLLAMDGLLARVDARGGAVRRWREPVGSPARALAASYDGKRLAVGAGDTVAVWDSRTGRRRWRTVVAR